MLQEYTREAIKERVFVPASVESEIRTNIENQLNKCGIFYRVFSRRKSATSLEHKLATGKYGGDDDKKIQDLIGIRVNLYFQDDLDICKDLFEDIYELAEEKWSEKDMSNKNFEAAKINGVFKLPKYLVNKISNETWSMPIDQTFEIQLKTVFFEGWHEVEHDFRYKMKEKNGEKEINIWDFYPTYSRQLNSVVATLELCDRSMVVMFENFAHQLYKDRMWDMMIRMHFRVRISDQPLYDGLAEILENKELQLGKKLFKASRSRLIEKLKTLHRDVPISVNMIIAILNEDVLGNNEDINAIMKSKNVYKDGISVIEKSYDRRELLPLDAHYVFKNKVLVKGKAKYGITTAEVLERISNYIYKWMRNKFRPIFDDIPENCCCYENMVPGYQVRFMVAQDELKLSMRISHIAQDVGTRMWNTEVDINPNEDRTGIWMEIKNIMYDGRNISELERISRFSYPNFYRDIYGDEELTLYDVQPFGDKVYGVRFDNDARDLRKLIMSEERQTPVVILASEMNDDGSGQLDESWIYDRWLRNLHKQVRYYAHVYRCDIEKLSLAVQDAYDTEGYQRGVYVFWPKTQMPVVDDRKAYDFYSEVEIRNCAYSRYKGEGTGIREDKVQDGDRAFMFMLVDEIKRSIIKE